MVGAGMDRPRLDDVAERAGVSPSTVSRVVNDKPGVANGTRQVVRDAIRSLRYEGVGIRRRDRPRRLVGVLVPELTNPVFPAFVQAFERQLAMNGCSTILATGRAGGTAEDAYLRVLLDQGLDGLAMISTQPDALGREDSELLRSGVPVVIVNGMQSHENWPPGWSAISIDHARATEHATRRLADLGHRRIGLVTGPAGHVPSGEHVDGYRRAHDDVRVEGDGVASIRHTTFTIEGGQSAAHDLLADGVTGVVCASDTLALGVVRAVRERGLEVPDDISVIGFDDAGNMSFTDPPMTSTRQPLEAMAGEAVRMLLDPPARPERRWFRGELVVRGSTGAAPRGAAARQGARG